MPIYKVAKGSKKGAGYVMPIDGEIMRFHVVRDPEDLDLGAYLVDIGAMGGNGECSCPWFQKQLKSYVPLMSRYGLWARCKHIRRARSYFLDEIIRELRKKHKMDKEETAP